MTRNCRTHGARFPLAHFYLSRGSAVCREQKLRIQRAYNRTEKGRARFRRYTSSGKGRAAMRRYNVSERGRARAIAHNLTEKGRARFAVYNSSEKGRARLLVHTWRKRDATPT